MSDDFYPVTGLPHGSVPPHDVPAYRGRGARRRLGLLAGVAAFAVAVGTSAFAVGQLASAEHEPRESTSVTQAPDGVTPTAPAPQPAPASGEAHESADD
jgi:hypothetical protein